MNVVYLLLGSNLGKRENHILAALSGIEKRIGKIVARSHFYSTQAWGNTAQDDFLNMAACIETNFSAVEVMNEILHIEKSMGRMRKEKWEPRIIDIDILFFNSEIISTAHLTVPHPHLHERSFALIPLHEIAPEFVHPVLQKPVRKLMNECRDSLKADKISKI